MASKNNILKSKRHRQYAIPDRPWQHYQEWHNNIMLHWKIDAQLIQDEIPEGLELDLHQGYAYVSIIAFTVCRLSPRFFPVLPFISNFDEINLRTYVVRDGKPGIYFLSIEASKLIPAILARCLMGLPYKKSKIKRSDNCYLGRGKRELLEVIYQPLSKNFEEDKLDFWLTERHCLYGLEKGRLFRIDIHHRPWKLYNMGVWVKILNYKYCKDIPILTHYSPKIKVLLWSRIFLDRN